MHGTTWDCALLAHLRTWEAWTWEVHEIHSPPGTVPSESTQEPEQLAPGKFTRCKDHLELCKHRVPGKLSGLDLGSACHLGMWQPSCGPSTLNAPHTCLWCLSAVSFPIHSTTEEVNLNKWPLLPLMSGWRLDTEETSKKTSLSKEVEPSQKWHVQQIKVLQLN